MKKATDSTDLHGLVPNKIRVNLCNPWLIILALLGFFACQQSPAPQFKLLSPEQTGIDFVNHIVDEDSFNIIQYLYYYNGGGVAIGDINNDGLNDIFFTSNRESNRLYLNKGNLQFEDITEPAGVAGIGNWSTGVSMIDINADGWLDIYVCQVGAYKGFEGKNQLFINQGFGTQSHPPESPLEGGRVPLGDSDKNNFADKHNTTSRTDSSHLERRRVSDHDTERKNITDKQTSTTDSSPLEGGHRGVISIPKFKESASLYGLDHEGFSTQAAFLDYDLDGDLDMYLLCHSVHSTETYRDTASTRQRDLYAGDKLFRNDLNSPGHTGTHFTEVSEEAGILGGIAGYGLGIAVGDIDQNGCPDVYVGNDFHENDFLYLNNCDGTFTESASKVFQHTSNFSMGNEMVDINNDGWLDVLTLDMKPDDEVIFKSAEGFDSYDIYRFKRSFGYADQFPRNMLQVSMGDLPNEDLRFRELGQLLDLAATDWSWSALVADFDNNGWKDIHISNGILRRPNNLDYINFFANKELVDQSSDLELLSKMPEGKVSNYLFANESGLKLKDQSEEWGIDKPSFSQGAAYADLDRDGDLDLVVNNMNDAAFVYENTGRNLNRSTSMHFLQVKLNGSKENPNGIGAKVHVYTNDQVQFQELHLVKGWQSSVAPELHFGLGTNEQIDSLVIEWPDQKQQKLRNLKVDQFLTLDYAEALEKEKNPSSTSNTLFTQINNLPFQHQENLFFDNKRESLIPYLLSSQGPNLATADVNGDGLEDAFIGGAAEQSGQLFFQQKDKLILEAGADIFEANASSEDIGIAFFDANGDSKPDLYVASGGNQFYGKDKRLLDRLYLNDGQGTFSLTQNSLPELYNQSSCVKPADFDQDGDIDLFVGSRSVPLNYGMPADSYLLLNDGSGKYSIAPKEMIDLSRLGMVCDAAWTDTDQDGHLDLVIVGDWMPLTVFKNRAGKSFANCPISKLAHSYSGFWNCIEVADMDGDGDEDWLVGNWGLNSNLRASKDQPIRLYLKDIDGNFSQDPIISYYRQNKVFTYASLDELTSQLVMLKKRFRQYNTFANSSFNEVFLPGELDGSYRREITELRSVFVRNDGDEFTIIPLPLAAQEAPIFDIVAKDIDQDGLQDAILVGNFFDIQPSIGKMDASFGLVLKGTKKGGFEPIPNSQSGLKVEGQARAARMMQVGDDQVLLVAKNNDIAEQYRLNLRK